jgi:flagellar motor switch protein FliM
MSEAELETQPVLSREELDAILTTVREARESGQGARPFRIGRDRDVPRATPVMRMVGEFAEEWGRVLSTLYQRAVRLELLSAEPLSLRELRDVMLPTDRVASLELRPGAGPVHLLLGRTLLFGWLSLAFGSRTAGPGPLLERPYTRIEERFLKRAALEIARQLAVSLRLPGLPSEPAVELFEPDMLPEAGGRKHLVLSFELTGFDDVCRLRIALPDGLAGGQTASVERPHRPGTSLEAPMLDMPVRVRVEAGQVSLSLRRLAELKVGDVLPLEAADTKGLVVRIEDEAKFRAVRGTVGHRLAVQLTDRL